MKTYRFLIPALLLAFALSLAFCASHSQENQAESEASPAVSSESTEADLPAPAAKPEADKPSSSEADAEPVETEEPHATDEPSEPEELPQETPVPNAELEDAFAAADRRAVTYDYDGAISLLQEIDGYEQFPAVTEKIAEYTAARDAMVLVDPSEITHIFYHSLIVDPSKAFGTDSLSAGFKQWMTTVDEFNAITQTMYDEGYVLISIYDIVEEITDENGTVHMVQKDLYLPEGKKAFLLSLDDLSYYHSYDNRGIASKLVLDENGKPTCEYMQDDGTVVTGAYDCVPLLDAFLEEHPDGCYHDARGMIALTGYDGILGYRTDIAYSTRENLDPDQEVWLDAHPEFDWDAERAEAAEVADALKADGWIFASHTWGHIKAGDSSLERLQRDTTKWLTYVEPLTGPTDIIVFAHGQDLAPEDDYPSSEKFTYLKSQGFNMYFTVDSRHYTFSIQDEFVHGGRRNLDGYRLWNDACGNTNWTEDLFDASAVLDPRRTDMPEL